MRFSSVTERVVQRWIKSTPYWKFTDMPYKELKALCKERGLSTRGRASILQVRLSEAEAEAEAEEADVEAEVEEAEAEAEER